MLTPFLYVLHICADELYVSACLLSRFSPVQLCATLWTGACQAPVHGIPQAWILEWVAMPSSRGSSQPRDRTGVSYIYLH